MERSKVSHLETILRILRYVKYFIGCKILFLVTEKGRKCNLLRYTYSNCCGDKDDIKSVVGYIFMFYVRRNINLMVFKKGTGNGDLFLWGRVYCSFIVCVPSRMVKESVGGVGERRGWGCNAHGW